MNFQNETHVSFPRQRVVDWFMRPGAFVRLAPSFDRISAPGLTPGIAEGMKSAFRLSVGPLRFNWKSIHHVEADHNFTDVMISGPFTKWKHHHQFLSEKSGTRLLDQIEWRGPISSLFTPIFKAKVNRTLVRNFQFRQRRLLHDLNRHEKYSDQPRLKIGITGATGVIGSALSAFLSTGGHEVFHFVRRESEHDHEIFWNPKTQKIDAEKVRLLDAVIHLAGENVAGQRWTPAFKKEVLESRSLGTALIAKTLADLKDKSRKLISASAIGIYSGGFLGEVCEAWEKALEPALHQEHLKVTITRIGVVLTSKGGALKELTLPTLLGLGGKMGNGKQMMSWISQDDVISAFLEILFNPNAQEKIYDLVSPQPIEQQELSRTLSKVLHRPHFFTTPAFAIKMAFGQMGEEVLLSGQEVLPKGLQKFGFKFEFTSLEDLLRFELGRQG